MNKRTFFFFSVWTFTTESIQSMRVLEETVNTYLPK